MAADAADLPRARPAAPALASAPALALALALALAPAPQRVLLIEDTELDAELLRDRLHLLYPTIQEVRWIGEATDILGQVAGFAPDLLITDFHMPGYDVLGTLQQLRRRWPALPMLVVSSLVGEEAAIQVLKAGANDFLPKSRLERLGMVIDRELTEARVGAELELQRQINQAIFDQTEVGLWILSPAGVIERTNRQALRMMGESRGLDVEGFATIEGWWVDSGQPIAPEEWPGAVALLQRQHVPPRLMRVRNFNGQMCHFSCSAAPLDSADGKPLGAVISAMDMSAEMHLRERLHDAEQRLRALSLSQGLRHEEQMAVVSRDLHDNLGQVLSLLKLHLGSAARRDIPIALRELEINEALPLIDLALSRLREVCNELRPTELSDFGLGSALNTLCKAAARASGMRVLAEEVGEAQPLDPALQLGLFRIGQQALTNALCHARAQAVTVTLRWDEGRVEIEVADDGDGFDPGLVRSPLQHGLRGMRERMELLGGTFTVDSSPGAGTRVQASATTFVAAGSAW